MGGHSLSQMIARCLLGCQTLLCMAVIVTLLSATTPALAVGRPSFIYVGHSRSNSLSIYEMNTATGDLVPRGEVAAGRSPVALAVFTEPGTGTIIEPVAQVPFAFSP
jgi:hypothetical protein